MLVVIVTIFFCYRWFYTFLGIFTFKIYYGCMNKKNEWQQQNKISFCSFCEFWKCISHFFFVISITNVIYCTNFNLLMSFLYAPYAWTFLTNENGIQKIFHSIKTTNNFTIISKWFGLLVNLASLCIIFLQVNIPSIIETAGVLVGVLSQHECILI